MGETYSKSKQVAFMADGKSTFDDVGTGSQFANTHSQQTDTSTFYKGTVGMTGERNPFWKDQIRHEQDATTAFSGTMLSGHSGLCFASAKLAYHDIAVGINTRESKWKYRGFLSYPIVPSTFTSLPGDIQARVLNRCIARFLENCTSVRSSIEGGQDFGEYKETLRTILNPLGSLRNKIGSYFSSLRKAKKRYRNPETLRKVLGDTYLEFRFGINPLVSDVASLIADAGRFRFPTYPVSGKAHEKYDATASTQGMSLLQFPNGCTMQLNKHTEYRVRYKGAIRSGAQASGQLSWAQSLRLLPEDWLPTAWDLLPFSWVADYFTNIGEIFNALSFVEGNIVWGCRTDRIINTVKYEGLTAATLSPPNPAIWATTANESFAHGGESEFRYTSVQRSKLSHGDFLPAFVFRIPGGKYPYFNMTAVLSGYVRNLVPFHH